MSAHHSGSDSGFDTSHFDVMGAYADRLAHITTNLGSFHNYRRFRPRQFVDVCKFHLSLLVDLPVEFNYYPPTERRAATSRSSSRQGEKNQQSRPWTRLAASMSQQLLRIDSFLGKEEASTCFMCTPLIKC